MPKITVIDSGSAIEKPMNEPKVTMYSKVSDQVCLLLKIANCLAMFSFIVAEGGQFHHQQGADDNQRHRDPHVQHAQVRWARAGTGREPIPAGTKVSVYSQVILTNATRVPPMSGDTVHQVVHAEPAQLRQWNKRKQPGKSGVLNPGRRAGGDLAENPAAVLHQRHRVAAKRAENAHRHHQRNDDLHRR